MFTKKHPVNLNSVTTATALSAHDQELTSLYDDQKNVSTDFAGDTPPQFPVLNVKWLDTSTSPYPTLKRWDGTNWITQPSYPASDVYPWAKETTKPAYTATEVGAAEAEHDHVMADITDLSAISTVPSFASQAEAEAGTASDKIMSPLRVAQAITALEQIGSIVSITAGTVADGGTIPLPDGYTREQCKYALWPAQIIDGATEPKTNYLSVNQSTGVVTAKYGDNTGYTAGYLCIGVK